MKDQPAGGHVFNMDGAGADGNATPRFAAYGATKRSLQQVGRAACSSLASVGFSLAAALLQIQHSCSCCGSEWVKLHTTGALVDQVGAMNSSCRSLPVPAYKYMMRLLRIWDSSNLNVHCPCDLQLGKSLEAELKLAKISNVGVHNLSPGMVTTELLMSGANTSAAKFFINCLGMWPAGCCIPTCRFPVFRQICVLSVLHVHVHVHVCH